MGGIHFENGGVGGIHFRHSGMGGIYLRHGGMGGIHFIWCFCVFLVGLVADTVSSSDRRWAASSCGLPAE